MRFCPNCNSAVYDDRAELCPECGKPMNQNVCPSCGRRLQPGQKCPHCSDCRAHGERYTVRNQSPEQTVSGGLSMWAYMGLILLAMVPVIGLIFMIVWACGVSSNPQLARFARGMLLAKALDDRVGCYNLLRLLDCDPAGDTDFVFTCQEEVGCRGAAGAAFRLRPDIGLALEGTTANDTGDVPAARQVCRAGEGVAVSFMDNASIANPGLFREMLALAKARGISHQVKMGTSGGNEGGAMQRSRSGARTCVLSVPCRYIHSASTVCAQSDVEAQYQLAKAFLEK